METLQVTVLNPKAKKLLKDLAACGLVTVQDKAQRLREWNKQPLDDGSLAFLFRSYQDDGIREEVVNFGENVGAEQW